VVIIIELEMRSSKNDILLNFTFNLNPPCYSCESGFNIEIIEEQECNGGTL